MADWWAGHANGGSSRPGDAPTLPDNEKIVEATVSAFRAALRRTEGIESAADLQQEGGPLDSDAETSPESLDYFAPAFHRALGRPDHRTEADSPENEGDAAGEGSLGNGAEDSSPAESLDYFAPAFRKVLGKNEDLNAERRNGTCNEADEAVSDETVDAGETAESLDYFAPAFRRALGSREGAESDGFWNNAGEAESRDRSPVMQLGEPVQGLSGEGFKHLSALELSEASRSGLDVDRLVERFFTSPSRDVVGVNGG